MNLRTCVISALSIIFLLNMSFAGYGQNISKASVGIRGGYTTRNNTATTGLYLSYRFSEHFRLSPKLDYAFPHDKCDGFSINLDTEYPLSLSQTGRVKLYPIAGLNWSTYTERADEGGILKETKDTHRLNQFGINVGAGLEYCPTPTLRMAVEAKGLMIRKNTGGWFSATIGYNF